MLPSSEPKPNSDPEPVGPPALPVAALAVPTVATASAPDRAPLLVVVDPLSVAAMKLAHHLPSLVQEALLAADRCDLALARGPQR